MIDFGRLSSGTLRSDPYHWAQVDRLFDNADATVLAQTFPRDRFKTVESYGGEKDYLYEARALVHMGETSVANAHALSDAWRGLACDFLSPSYRAALTALTGCDVSDAPLEVNVFHYGPGALLGPHPDLADKLVTHIMYFNQTWDSSDGGCLTILSDNQESSVVATVVPYVGNSAVLVRSDASWHAVSRVLPHCDRSRRSLTATFYRRGSVSTMWPPGDEPELHAYGS